MRKIKNQSGFTIIEMIIYMGILSVLLLVLTTIFSSALDVQLESESFSSVEQDSRFILKRFAYDIKNASSILFPANINDAGNTLQLQKDGVTTTYFLDNQTLKINNNFGTNVLNSFDSTVSNLSFKRLGNIGGKNTIQITFTVTSRITQPKGLETKTFQATFGTR